MNNALAMCGRVGSHGLRVLATMHAFIQGKRGAGALVAAFLLGAFSVLGFAPFHIFPALIVAFSGLVWLLDGGRQEKYWARAMFVRGWAFAAGCFLTGLHWTALPFLVEPEKHAVFLWMPLFALPGGLALIWGVACALCGVFWSSSPSRILVFVVFAGMAEWVRGVLFGGFPWNLPGTTWVPGSALSQAAAIGGVYWLGLVTLFVAVTPAALVNIRQDRTIFQVMPVCVAVVLTGLGWVWGWHRLSNRPVMTDQVVLLMDAGVPQTVKFKDRGLPVLVRYIDLLKRTPGNAGDIVIWPENALPYGLLADREVLHRVSESLGPRNLIAGSVRLEPAVDGMAAYNSMVLLAGGDSSISLAGLYDKHRLVPFGELSAVRIIPFGQKISGFLPSSLQRMAVNGLNPGEKPTVLIPKIAIPAFIPLICYEGLFPELVRQARPRREAAQWIVVISNDAWFGGGLGPAQHYAQNRYRAIESGLPMARVASRGVTAMIDGHGREIARGAPAPGDFEGWNSSLVRTQLPARLDMPAYQRFGESLYWVTLVLMAGLAFVTEWGWPKYMSMQVGYVRKQDSKRH